MRTPSATARERNTCSWRQRLLLAVLALIAAGCQQAQLQSFDTPSCDVRCDDASSRSGREVAMNRNWQNRRFSELKTALGPPRLIMNIPGGGNPPGFIAVYGADPVTGCIDAFAFVYSGDPVMRLYHCR